MVTLIKTLLKTL